LQSETANTISESDKKKLKRAREERGKAKGEEIRTRGNDKAREKKEGNINDKVIVKGNYTFKFKYHI